MRGTADARHVRTGVFHLHEGIVAKAFHGSMGRVSEAERAYRCVVRRSDWQSVRHRSFDNHVVLFAYLPEILKLLRRVPVKGG